MSSKPIKHHKQLLIKIKKGPNETDQMNILLIFPIEFLLKLVVRKSRERNHCGPTYHDHTNIISLSSSIRIEHMSQDTYSLSYGNFTPGRPLSFLYHIMIPTLSPDTTFILLHSVSEHVITASVNV